MKPETQARLLRVYAQFFEHASDVQRSLMGSGFDCGEGWAALVEAPLALAAARQRRWHEVHAIQERLKADEEFDPFRAHAWIPTYWNTHPNVPYASLEITQVKEKFGGLRIYWEGEADAYFETAVDTVCWLSASVCEKCGQHLPGRPSHGECGEIGCNPNAL